MGDGRPGQLGLVARDDGFHVAGLEALTKEERGGGGDAGDQGGRAEQGEALNEEAERAGHGLYPSLSRPSGEAAGSLNAQES